MNKHQEQRANKEVALKRPAGEQAHAGDAAEELRVSFAKIKIEAYNRTRAARQAVIDCELDHSQMTEACVRDLGFSLETGGGEKRRTLTLLLGAPEEPHTFRVTFLIVAEAKHDIVLNEAAADELHESSRGTNYPVFAVPVSKSTRQKRAQDRAERLEREKQETETKMKDASQQEQAARPTPTAVARL